MSEIGDKIFELLLTVVPEAADQEVEPDGDLREQLDIDSMDHLNFLIAVSREFDIDIPERDYCELVR